MSILGELKGLFFTQNRIRVYQGQQEPLYQNEYNNREEPDVSSFNTQDQCDDNSTSEDKFESEVCAPLTMTELDDILVKLPKGKSSGVDQIPSEFLSNSGFQFKKYLLTFYNKIIQDGKVPSDLNIGKCCLIWKVYKIGCMLSQTNLFLIFWIYHIYCIFP